MTKTKINDLVVLGMAIPQHLKDGRTTVCLGGYSREHGFIRVYPTKPDMGLSRWDVIEVEVEKNSSDTRQESWKIVGSRDNWEDLGRSIRKVGRVKDVSERWNLVTENTAECVSSLNEKHQSLGFIKPQVIHKMYFGKNQQYGQPVQLALFSSHAKKWAAVKHDYPVLPRLKYSCEHCRTQQGFHDQSVLEWGFYEWMRKNPNNIEQVWENARFLSEDHEIYLFVGNQQNKRNSYLVINSIPLNKSQKPSMRRLL